MVTAVVDRSEDRRRRLKTVIGGVDLVVVVIRGRGGGGVVACMRLIIDVCRGRRTGSVGGGGVGRRRRRRGWVGHDMGDGMTRNVVRSEGSGMDIGKSRARALLLIGCCDIPVRIRRVRR